MFTGALCGIRTFNKILIDDEYFFLKYILIHSFSQIAH